MKKRKTRSNESTIATQTTLARPFHITVGTSITPGGKISTEHELRLLKAALLYADKVKLCSLGSSLLFSFTRFKNLSESERIDVSMLLLQSFIDASQDEKIRELSSWIPIMGELQRNRKLKKVLKDQFPPNEFLQIHKVDKVFRELVNGIGPIFDAAVYTTTGGEKFNELEFALNSGLIDFQPIDPDTDHMVEDYFDIIANAIKSDQTYPLLDNNTGSLIGSAVKEGKIEVPNINLARARGVGLSADLLSRLPLFDSASVDEVISIRRELNSPLVRFRSAMIEFSDEIKSETWDKEFPLECESIFLKKVAPSILELEEAVKANSRLRVYSETFINDKVLLVASSSLGLLLGSENNLVNNISQFLPAAVSAATLVWKSERDLRESRKEIEQNQLYFYYKTGELFKQGKR